MKNRRKMIKKSKSLTFYQGWPSQPILPISLCVPRASRCIRTREKRLKSRKITKNQQKMIKKIEVTYHFGGLAILTQPSCVPRASKCIQTCEKHVKSRKFSKNDEKIDVTHHFGGLAILPHPSCVPRASECIETREKRPKSWKEKNYEKNDHKGDVIIQLLDQQPVIDPSPGNDSPCEITRPESEKFSGNCWLGANSGYQTPVASSYWNIE